MVKISSAQMSKLLIIVNVDWFFCSHRLPVALAALKRGYEVHVACKFTDPSLIANLSSHGLILHDLDIDRSAKRISSLFITLVRIYRLILSLSPNVIHLVTIQPVLLGGMAARLAGHTNIVYAISGLGHAFSAHSFLSRFRRLIVKAFYRLALSSRAKAVIFQNPDDQLLISRLCSITSEDSYLIPGSGVDLSLYEHKPLPDGGPVVLMVSRLLAAKGVREFVSSAALLRSRGVKVTFQLAGTPDQSNPTAISEEELRLWRDQGLVEILGQRRDIHNLMSSAHIVCLPSYYPEGLPKVLCEAAACGRAVITTNEPGCRDAIVDGQTGLLVPSMDSVALADAIQSLVSDFELMRSMGINARTRAESLYDLKNIVDSHLLIYNRLSSL